MDIAPQPIFFENPPIPHDGTEPAYKELRRILVPETPQHGLQPLRTYHAPAGMNETSILKKALTFLKAHPDMQLGPLVRECTPQQLENFLPVMKALRTHPKFDIHLYAEVQCRVLHQMLNALFKKPETENSFDSVYKTMDKFIEENADLDIQRFLSSPETGPRWDPYYHDKMEVAVHYMSPDHPQYEELRYEKLSRKVDDTDIQKMSTFFMRNPENTDTSLEFFSVRAEPEQLEMVLPFIPSENKYRALIQTRVLDHHIKNGDKEALHTFLTSEGDDIDMGKVWSRLVNGNQHELTIAFLSSDAGKNLSMEEVWSSLVTSNKHELAQRLDADSLIPAHASLNALLERATDLGHDAMAELLEFMIEDHHPDQMDVDSTSPPSSESR